VVCARFRRIQGLRGTQEKPIAAFIVFMREKTLDQAELEVYWSKVRATLEGRPIKILAAYGRHVTLEGPEVEGVVVAEFPSVEEARAWYDSPAYRAAAEHRFRGAVYCGRSDRRFRSAGPETGQCTAFCGSNQLGVLPISAGTSTIAWRSLAQS
jgi:uncharacterized protein (DUF1330 family)